MKAGGRKICENQERKFREKRTKEREAKKK
jgi:hypothetical protein